MELVSGMVAAFCPCLQPYCKVFPEYSISWHNYGTDAAWSKGAYIEMPKAADILMWFRGAK